MKRTVWTATIQRFADNHGMLASPFSSVVDCQSALFNKCPKARVANEMIKIPGRNQAKLNLIQPAMKAMRQQHTTSVKTKVGDKVIFLVAFWRFEGCLECVAELSLCIFDIRLSVRNFNILGSKVWHEIVDFVSFWAFEGGVHDVA